MVPAWRKAKDTDIVLEKVNDYLAGKIGVKLDIVNVEGADYTKKMQVVINTGSKWDLCFSSSWANDYLQNADKGAFLALDELVQNTEMYEKIDSRFWEAARYRENLWCTKRKRIRQYANVGIYKRICR